MEGGIGCCEAGCELVRELYQNYVCDGIDVIVNARCRGVIGPTCICTDARMAPPSSGCMRVSFTVHVKKSS
jgi:hypothetical protein